MGQDAGAWTRITLPVLVCIVAWCVLPGAGWAGAIKGVVRLKGAAVGQKTLSVTIDQYVCGREKDAEDLVVSPDGGIRHAVVSLQTPPPGAKWEATAPPVKIDQKQCAFVPHVVVTPVGATVEFLSSDPLLHNLHSFSKANPSFNRTQPKARTIPVVFKAPEIVRVDCDLHSWMRAWVVVAEHPFYAVTNEMGQFLLDNVPAGKYTLQIWQERLGTVTQEVTVGDKGISTVRVEMSAK